MACHEGCTCKHGEEIFGKTCMVYNMFKRVYMFWNMILKTCQKYLYDLKHA